MRGAVGARGWFRPGRGSIGGRVVMSGASTKPALRAAFPEMRWLPEPLDGWITLDVATGKSEATAPEPKRKKK